MRIDLTISDRRPQKSVLAALGPSNTGNFDIAMDGLGLGKVKCVCLNVMSSVAQFEREMMLERQREGIAKAKAEGKYKGRKPTARAKTDMVKLALDQGVTKAQICRDLQISKTSLYRIIGELRA